MKRVQSVFKVLPQLDSRVTAQYQCLKYYSNANIFCRGKIHYISLGEGDIKLIFLCYTKYGIYVTVLTFLVLVTILMNKCTDTVMDDG